MGDESNWLRLPEITKEVDTIYLYPTAYIDESEDAAEIADIDNESMRTAAAADDTGVIVSWNTEGPASFHNMDYGFYYENIKENVKVRIEAYFKLAK